MRNYYVEGTGWFVVAAKNKREAKSCGVAEYGRGNVRLIRLATESEVRYYVEIKGHEALSV